MTYWYSSRTIFERSHTGPHRTAKPARKSVAARQRRSWHVAGLVASEVLVTQGRDDPRQMDGALLRQGTPRPGLGDPKGGFRRHRSPVGEAIARPPTGVGSDRPGVSRGVPVGGPAPASG